jgi:hypothetical protein
MSRLRGGHGRKLEQALGEGSNVRQTTLGILFEAAQDDGVEPSIDVATELANRRRRPAQDLGAHLGYASPVERVLARQELVQEDAERPNVGAGVDVRRVHHLFGRHVPGRAETLRRVRESATPFVGETLGDSEIEDLQNGAPVGISRQKQIRRFDVPVDER